MDFSLLFERMQQYYVASKDSGGVNTEPAPFFHKIVEIFVKHKFIDKKNKPKIPASNRKQRVPHFEGPVAWRNDIVREVSGVLSSLHDHVQRNMMRKIKLFGAHEIMMPNANARFVGVCWYAHTHTNVVIALPVKPKLDAVIAIERLWLKSSKTINIKDEYNIFSTQVRTR